MGVPKGLATYFHCHKGNGIFLWKAAAHKSRTFASSSGAKGLKKNFPWDVSILSSILIFPTRGI